MTAAASRTPAASEMLDRLAAKAGRLCSLPAVAMKVLELTRNPQVDVPALKQCIENDPALTGKILRVVNSSLFGLSGEVSDLTQALALLGTKPLKMLVLGFSLPSGLFAGVASDSLSRYWRHTLTKAIAGREIAEKFWRMPGDDAFIAGLLQDIGELLLMQELGDAYTTFLNKVHAGGNDLAELETATLGFAHTQLSAKLLEAWGLPDTLVEVVANTSPSRRGDGLSEETRTLSQIVHMGELTARLLVDCRPEALARLRTAARHYRDMEQEDVDALTGDLEEKVRQLADVLSLHLPEGLDYRDVLARAHEQLSEVADASAGDLLRQQQTELLDENVIYEVQALAQAVADVAKRPAGAAIAKAPAQPQPSVEVAEPVEVCDFYGPVPAETALLEQLSAAVAACRQSRRSISLLLVSLDRSQRLTEDFNEAGFAKALRVLNQACHGLDHPWAICHPHGRTGFALVLPDCERREAVELGSQLIRDFRSAVPASADETRRASISIGAATVSLPPKNFPATDLFAAADRCLYGSRASGGEVVKSIEIY